MKNTNPRTLIRGLSRFFILLFCFVSTMLGANESEREATYTVANITGTIVADSDGQPIIGANILVKGCLLYTSDAADE